MSRSRAKPKLTYGLEALWLAAAVAVPLVFNPWGDNAFELPKALLLRAFVLLMGLIALIQALEVPAEGNPPQRGPLPRPLLWSALGLGLVLALATVTSFDPRASLWGSYERQQGLLTRIAYLGLLLLTAANLHRRVQIERLWSALVWSSAPVVAYGLLQGMGLDPLDWRTDAASPVLSTVGRANFLGSYLVLLLPLTAARLLASRRRRWHGLLLAGQLACLALTQARGAWIGAVAALEVGLFAWSIATGDRRPALAALGVVVVGGGFVALLNLPAGPLTPLVHLPGLDRLAALGRTDAGSTAARITIWRATLPLVAARPALGYGPETMRPVFARVFPPELVYYQGRHATVDRAHNLWLDLGMSAGIAGIVAFAALLIACGRPIWRGLRQAGEIGERAAWVALAAALAGHLADLQFSFDLTASAATFWLILALVAALGRERRPCPEATNPPYARRQHPAGRWRDYLPYAPPTLVVLALALLLCGRPLLADMAAWRSRQDAPALEAARRAVRLWPPEPEYRLRLAWLLAEWGDFAAAEAQLAAARRLSPRDAQNWAAQGEIYATWGSIGPGWYAQAEEALRRAVALAPNVATYHATLGMVLAQQGRPEAGAAELERAVTLDATDAVAFRHLADLYRALGQETRAAWALEEAERWSE